jgi:hypothetical protein
MGRVQILFSNYFSRIINCSKQSTSIWQTGRQKIEITSSKVSYWCQMGWKTNRNSETASTYSQKFSKAHAQIIAEIQARLEWIGVDWVEDEDSEDQDEDDGVGRSRRVRFLDYACGTGSMSRVCSISLTTLIFVQKEDQVERAVLLEAKRNRHWHPT